MDKGAMVECLVNHYCNGNKAQFAKMLGVTAQTISSWIARNTFDAELIYAKCDGVSGEWLLSEKGEMIKSSEYKQNVDIPDEKNEELVCLCKKIADNYLERNLLLGQLMALARKD